MRDISRSSIQDLGGNSGGRRLLRLGLTDGITEITAIEYTLVPAIPDDIVPGTKVICSCSELAEPDSLTVFDDHRFLFRGTISVLCQNLKFLGKAIGIVFDC